MNDEKPDDEPVIIPVPAPLLQKTVQYLATKPYAEVMNLTAIEGAFDAQTEFWGLNLSVPDADPDTWEYGGVSLWQYVALYGGQLHTTLDLYTRHPTTGVVNGYAQLNSSGYIVNTSGALDGTGNTGNTTFGFGDVMYLTGDQGGMHVYTGIDYTGEYFTLDPTGKIGFFGATPVDQQALPAANPILLSDVITLAQDIRDLLAAYGLADLV